MPRASTTTWPFTGRRAEVEAFSAAHADSEVLGVVAIGPRGIGTTRLVQHCADQFQQGGATVLRIWAGPASRPVPLAALLPVLPAAVTAPGAGDLPEVLRRAREAFGNASRVVLVVDQLHDLDEASATVIDQLLQSGQGFLVGSVAERAPAPDGVASLWSQGRIQRVPVGPLDRAGLETLLHRALGGAVDGEATADLRAASGGNPLLLHELVDGAIASGTLAEVGGVWRASGPLPVAGRAADVLERRFRDLEPDALAALEDILVGGNIGLADLERSTDPAVIEQLDRDGFVTVRAERRRIAVELAHPAIGAVIRRGFSPLRARRLALAHIARVEGHGARRADDVLRIARWHLDAMGTAPVATLLAAARIARKAHDFATVEQLARAAVAEGTGVPASLLLGEALYEVGRFAEAEAAYAAADVARASDDERGALAVSRATNLFWGLMDGERARASVQHAATGITSPTALRSLAIESAATVLYGGDPARAVSLLPPVDEADPRARVEAALVLSPAAAVAGRTAEAIAIADRAFADHMALGEVTGLAHPGTHMMTKCLALTEAGRLDEAWELARAGYDLAVADRAAVAKMWLAMMLGRTALLRGDVALAARWFREQVVHARTVGHGHPTRMGLAGIAITAAYLDDAATSAAAVAEILSLRGSDCGFYLVEGVRAEAWSLAVNGRIAEGRALLPAATEEARATGQLALEAAAWYDFVRLGGAAVSATERLLELAALSDSEMIAGWSDHVAALAAQDAEGLAAAVDRFEVMGARLFAAEAATAATDLLRRNGDQRGANAMGLRAGQLSASCEGARTPGLLATGQIVPLTAREREIAYLVARGLPSKDIAEQLFLSVRTVQNHLQRIYDKLGVSARSEVGPALLGVDPDLPATP